MKQLTIYRVLTFILVPFAAIFGGIGFFILLAALGNPTMLLPVFVFGSFAIYVFTSIRFLYRSIDTGRSSKSSLRDWIRVNAFVSFFMGTMFLLNAISIFVAKDAELRNYIEEFIKTQPNVPKILSPEVFLKMMKIVAGFMFVVSIVLLVHIRMNFRLLKQYGHLFGSQEQ